MPLQPQFAKPPRIILFAPIPPAESWRSLHHCLPIIISARFLHGVGYESLYNSSIMSNYNYQKPQNLATLSTVAYECLGDAWQPTFGFLFPENDDLAPVKSLVADEDAEISLKNIHILSDKDDNTLGVTAALPLADVQPMRQKMLFKLIGMAEDKAAFMEKMNGYADRFPKFPEDDGIYLSKFSVARTHRGQGLSHILMMHFLEEYNQGLPYFLEVHKDNAAAIALYENHKFKIISDEADKEYLLMKRTP